MSRKRGLTASTTDGLSNWRGDTLTETPTPGATSCQRARSPARRCCNIHSPIGWMRPGLLGDADELVGRDELHVGTLPAHERFEVRRAARRERDDRLVVRDELVAVDRAPQRRLEVEAGRHEGLHALVEQLDAAAAAVLGAVHGGVGVADELVGAFVAAVPHRDTDRGGEHDFVDAVAEDERRAQHLVEPAGAVGDLVDVAGLVAEHDELVAAEPGHRVAVAGRGTEPARRPPRGERRRRRDRGCR